MIEGPLKELKGIREMEAIERPKTKGIQSHAEGIHKWLAMRTTPPPLNRSYSYESRITAIATIRRVRK